MKSTESGLGEELAAADRSQGKCGKLFHARSKQQRTMFNLRTAEIRRAKLLLRSMIAKIKALPSYQSDPSCLIPIIVYAVNTSNATEATDSLKLLESLNTSQYKIDPAFNSAGIIEIKDLKVLVEGVNIRKEENKANIIYF